MGSGWVRNKDTNCTENFCKYVMEVANKKYMYKGKKTCSQLSPSLSPLSLSSCFPIPQFPFLLLPYIPMSPVYILLPYHFFSFFSTPISSFSLVLLHKLPYKKIRKNISGSAFKYQSLILYVYFQLFIGHFPQE